MKHAPKRTPITKLARLIQLSERARLRDHHDWKVRYYPIRTDTGVYAPGQGTRRFK